MKEFRCGEVVPGCGAVLQGQSDDDVLQEVAVHARDEHGMHEVPPEVADTIRSKIREV